MQIMAHVNPPYRCDVVGSFLRPKSLAQARARFAAGQITRAQLTEIEDAAIADLVRKERENGLTAVTDGEFRRAFWHLDFLAALGGIRHVKAEAWSVHF
jgi:5-methyltetrahydropteroyltriglutamate--homocysteine methyltransferase